MNSYFVNTKLDPSTQDFSPIVNALWKRNWNAKIIFDAHRDEEYSYQKQLKYKYGSSWFIVATNNLNLDLTSISFQEIISNNTIEASITEIFYESGDGLGDLIWCNHSDEDMLEDYKNSTPPEVYKVLEECKHHCYVKNYLETEKGESQASVLCKDVAECLAALIGSAMCTCEEDGDEIYSSYTLVSSTANLREAATKSICKLLSIEKKEMKSLGAKEILDAIRNKLPSRFFNYDPECIENTGNYTAILTEHLKQSGLFKKNTLVRDELNPKENSVDIFIEFGTEKHHWKFSQDNDWVEHEFYVNLAQLISEKTKGSITFLETSDQTIDTLFIETEIDTYLRSEGLISGWI